MNGSGLQRGAIMSSDLRASPTASGWTYSKVAAMQSVLQPSPASQAERLAAALAQLNDEQRAAVEHGVDAAVGDVQRDDRPLLVIAGAGSGKTSTLAHRVAHLIAGGADPQRLLLLTFSRRAAQEMGRR